MRLTRTGSPFRTEHGVIGHRGLLVVGLRAWPTIERWDVDTKLVADSYDCEFGLWTNSAGHSWKAIRVLLTPMQFEIIYPEKRRLELIKQVGERKARGRIYFHASNYPHQIEGCIAVGRREIPGGVAESRVAMFEVFEALGGWRENERMTLEVTT